MPEGQYNNPVRVGFNTGEGWTRDVSEDVADEIEAGTFHPKIGTPS